MRENRVIDVLFEAVFEPLVAIQINNLKFSVNRHVRYFELILCPVSMFFNLNLHDVRILQIGDIQNLVTFQMGVRVLFGGRCVCISLENDLVASEEELVFGCLHGQFTVGLHDYFGDKHSKPVHPIFLIEERRVVDGAVDRFHVVISIYVQAVRRIEVPEV